LTKIFSFGQEIFTKTFLSRKQPVKFGVSMSKTVVLVFVLVLLTASCTVAFMPVWVSADAVADSWVSKTPMHEARGSLGVAVVNGKIYAIGGSVKTQTGPFGYIGQVGTNEEYDPATDTWVFKAQMPTARSGFAIAAYQGKIYCIGGYLENRSKTGVNEVYDPATDTWETKTSMPTARWLLQANVVNGKIYLVSGSGGGTVNEVYDPATDSWTTGAPTEAFYAASTVVDNEIYIISDNRTQIYNPETDTWRIAAQPPPHLVQGAAAATTGVLATRRIYVMGVTQLIFYGDPPPCLTQVYDPASDSWTSATSMPTNRANFGVAVINDTIYTIGGHTHDTFGFIYPSAVNEQYTPIGYGTPDPTPSPSTSPLTSPSPESQPEPESFPTMLVASVSAVSAVAAVACVLVYFKKRKSVDK
jgi:N-acetylneuraminic acid mutarotase